MYELGIKLGYKHLYDALRRVRVIVIKYNRKKAFGRKK
jgi:hypothetical protein